MLVTLTCMHLFMNGRSESDWSGRECMGGQEAETLSLTLERSCAGRSKMRAWEVCFKAADAETDCESCVLPPIPPRLKA